DTVAIGDSNNDLAMLSCVNTAIAMGNATKRVLDIAHRVTTCVDEDGVWNALKWLGVI
ncbi:MAG: HAD hydrolase family protein, partial [Lachnospiraceae bacterium]|nr:HAD hydrolase family protein [Lachnospiraceae bacterium]